MTRITISMPEDLAAALLREARRRREPFSAVARRAIRAHLAEDRGRLSIVAIGRSGHRDPARAAESIPAEEWARDRDR